jgi:hypothetical protein
MPGFGERFQVKRLALRSRMNSRALAHEVDTTGAVVTVHSTGGPPIWTLDTLLTLGSEAQVGEPPPDEFGLITSAIPDRDGFLWIADAQNNEI